MQKILGAVLACSLMSVGSAAFAEATPVGVVDYQKVAQAISFQKVMNQRMQDSVASERKTLTDATTKIAAKEKELKDKVAALSADQKKALEADLATQRAALAKIQSSMQTKMMSLRQNLGDEIKGKLEQMLGTIAAKHNVQTVYTSMGLAYAANKVDLTNELIEELAKIYGRADATPAKGMMNPAMRGNDAQQ